MPVLHAKKNALNVKRFLDKFIAVIKSTFQEAFGTCQVYLMDLLVKDCHLKRFKVEKARREEEEKKKQEEDDAKKKAALAAMSIMGGSQNRPQRQRV